MRFYAGQTPQWAGKPKASPLDDDNEFLKLKAKIANRQFKPSEQAGLYVNEEEDGERLKAKNPARMVRDTIRRVLREFQVEHDYRLVCRRTAQPGEWAVWLTYRPVRGKRD